MVYDVVDRDIYCVQPGQVVNNTTVCFRPGWVYRLAGLSVEGGL
jgi:hypothetical protein